MTTISSAPFARPADHSILSGLGPLVAVVFLGFLSVGVPLAALSLEVGEHLGFGPMTVGCLIGLQSLVTVVTRHRAGTVCDAQGPRRAVIVGLPLAAASGLLYAVAALLEDQPAVGLGILALGRVVAGLGESLFMTGTMSWGIARVGVARTGRVMSWQGIAMYAALGLGAPFGLLVQTRFGFAGVGCLTALMPSLACAVALLLPGVPAAGADRVPFHHVLGLIWRPGLVLALATVPFAAMAAFLALDFAARGWPHAGAGLFGFGTAYILVRLVASGLPDRFGPTPVVAGSLLIEALGQALIWWASEPTLAVVGATLTGLGFSLVFPAMGVLATRSVPPNQRGRAVGNSIAFFDIALGLTGPVVGAATLQFGIASAFLVGVAAATGAALLLIRTVPAPQAAA